MLTDKKVANQVISRRLTNVTVNYVEEIRQSRFAFHAVTACLGSSEAGNPGHGLSGVSVCRPKFAKYSSCTSIARPGLHDRREHQQYEEWYEQSHPTREAWWERRPPPDRRTDYPIRCTVHKEPSRPARAFSLSQRAQYRMHDAPGHCTKEQHGRLLRHTQRSTGGGARDSLDCPGKRSSTSLLTRYARDRCGGAAFV